MILMFQKRKVFEVSKGMLAVMLEITLLKLFTVNVDIFLIYFPAYSFHFLKCSNSSIKFHLLFHNPFEYTE